MNTVPIKYGSFSEIKKKHPHLERGFSFRLSPFHYDKDMNFMDFCTLGISVYDEREKQVHSIYKNLREAFDDVVKLQKERLKEVILTEIPETLNKTTYSWFGQFFPKNQKRKIKMDAIINRVIEYKALLDDEEAMNKIYEDNLKRYENALDKEVSYLDLDLGLYDKIYMLQEQINFHSTEGNAVLPFSIVHYIISEIRLNYKSYKTLSDNEYQPNERLDFDYNIHIKKSNEYQDYHYSKPSIQFVRSNKVQDAMVLSQGVSNYRLFLRAKELQNEISIFKDQTVRAFSVIEDTIEKDVNNSLYDKETE